MFEDCTLVHPDNAVALSVRQPLRPGEVLQLPHGGAELHPAGDGGQVDRHHLHRGHAPTGQLHVDLEDCTLAGYSVFTPGDEGKAATCTAAGRTQAAVQFKQEVPAGFERLGAGRRTCSREIARRRGPPRRRRC